MNKAVWIGAIVVIVLLVIVFIPKSSANNFDDINAINGEIDIYKSSTCGCCAIYSSYTSSKVSPKVNTFDVQDLSEIKNRYGVPPELESCHTTIIRDYFVEGHIPLEAVEKLMEEQPDIKGIAMPGMPSGSPGMPGQKYGDFIIYAVHHDGTYSEFMRI